MSDFVLWDLFAIWILYFGALLKIPNDMHHILKDYAD